MQAWNEQQQERVSSILQLSNSYFPQIQDRLEKLWKTEIIVAQGVTAPVKNSEVVIKLKQTKIALIVGLQQDNKWLVCTECQVSLIFRKLCDFERSWSP